MPTITRAPTVWDEEEEASYALLALFICLGVAAAFAGAPTFFFLASTTGDATGVFSGEIPSSIATTIAAELTHGCFASACYVKKIWNTWITNKAIDFHPKHVWCPK